jgi:hypothetical protein
MLGSDGSQRTQSIGTLRIELPRILSVSMDVGPIVSALRRMQNTVMKQGDLDALKAKIQRILSSGIPLPKSLTTVSSHTTCYEVFNAVTRFAANGFEMQHFDLYKKTELEKMAGDWLREFQRSTSGAR